MTYEISLTPDGRLSLLEAERSDAAIRELWTKSVADAFSSHQACGLFTLAALRPTSPLSPSVSYWREFAALFLSELCRSPEVSDNGPDAVEPPPLPQLKMMLASAPPMQGAE